MRKFIDINKDYKKIVKVSRKITRIVPHNKIEFFRKLHVEYGINTYF